MLVFSALLQFWADFFISVMKIEFIGWYFLTFISIVTVLLLFKKLKG